ncbi:ABC transporter substrate-binding protein [Clostridium thermosuccinogenes]|uniref:ABC transporter substrate-binding protein n=1 Tax=Clostridium thermosuccinogenes TaxID=84032 RepID=A0A2K2FHU4_9CLOT|nr:metal ABC transporter substrate-binding protein [Pseudoclostridium thermosuccinogenes]AUS98681.1 ABC transporter substrate-binding protein [Pseudoclostridium thermosuccinogenes]PNT98359.1 ABC transporter substrate-binding protein [Pseudoclostridium thermosuccinogenes]PNU00460.1 ABC transporter substrate-binding protein [Pseudoclostridium thermosuccinogenes]
MERMKRKLNIFLCALLMISTISLAACSSGTSGSKAEDESGKISVFTSIYPMYDFAGKIGGDKIDLYNMVPAGTEPHDWEPSPKDMARLEKADVFIYNGSGMEGWVEKVLNSINKEDMIVVEASEGVDIIENKPDDDEHISDPHVWLDPMRAGKQMENIMNALSKADPDNAKFYEENFRKYSVELEKLDKEYRDTLEKCEKKDIIVSHQAFGYLCDAYGLNQIAIGGLEADTEPSAGKIAEISDFVKEKNIKVIFFEELVSPKIAGVIAGETGAETMVLNPLEGLGDEDIKAGRDYFSVMRDNLKALEKALR